MTIRIYNSRVPKVRKCVRTIRHESIGNGLEGIYISYGEEHRNHNYHCDMIVKKNFAPPPYKVTAEDVRTVRDRVGCGIGMARLALKETDGDIEEAVRLAKSWQWAC